MKLSLIAIDKRYGANSVLNFDEWRISTGVYWLKGGNGTGKTTLFRIISGQTPFNGKVILDDINLKKEPVKFRSKISYAEAEPQYPSFITGRELLNFYKEVKNAQEAEIEELADLFEMTAFLNQKVGDYSSGMLKKLSIISAFIGEIDLYILDEPLITIDTTSANKLYQLIKKKSAQGKSFLISSHQEIDKDQIAIDGIFKIESKRIIAC